MNITDVESILAFLDENYVKTQECSSGSAYYRCGSLRIRVSNHFKKNLDVASCNDVTLIAAPGFDGFIVLLDRSLHPMVITDYEMLLDFLKYEKFRRDTFYPRPSADLLQNTQEELSEEPETFESDDTSCPWDCDWPLGKESKGRLDASQLVFRSRFKDVTNIAEFFKKVLQKPDGATQSGNLVSTAYAEAGLMYSKNVYKQYKTFTGSYREFVYSLGEPQKYSELLAEL